MRYGSQNNGRITMIAPAGGVVGGKAYAMGDLAGIAYSTVQAGEEFTLVITDLTKAIDVTTTGAEPKPFVVFVEADGDVSQDDTGVRLGVCIDPAAAAGTAKRRVVIGA